MTVRECVTKEVVAIGPDTSTKQAFRMMKSMGIRHLVVVRDRVVVGIVTDRDLRRPKIADMFKSWDELYRLSNDFQVEDVMTSPVITVNADDDVREAARLMVEHRVGALPVVDGNQLAGIITETDLLKALIAQ